MSFCCPHTSDASIASRLSAADVGARSTVGAMLVYFARGLMYNYICLMLPVAPLASQQAMSENKDGESLALSRAFVVKACQLQPNLEYPTCPNKKTCVFVEVYVCVCVVSYSHSPLCILHIYISKPLCVYVCIYRCIYVCCLSLSLRSLHITYLCI